MLSSSFVSEEGIDVEIAGGTASNPADQGGHESVEEKQTEPVDSGAQEDTPPSETKGGSVDESEPVEKTENVEPPKDGKPSFRMSEAEKVQRRFDRLKRNHQVKMQKRDARIAALTEELKKANDTISKLKSGEASEEQLLDAKLDVRDAQRELAKEQAAKAEEMASNEREIIGARIASLYPTSADMERYKRAISKGQQNGAFPLAMKNREVRDFIKDSDLGPKIVEHLCNRPDIMDKLESLSVERRKHELFGMEARLKAFIDAKPKMKTTNQTQQSVPGSQAPAIGKQANRGNANQVNGDWSSDEELFKFVRGNR